MKLVLVKWLDSHSVNQWTELERLKKNCKPARCKSVGWLLTQSNGHILLVPHIAENDSHSPDGAGSITIPEGAITKIETLRED